MYSLSDGQIIEDCTVDRTKADGSFSIGGLPEQKIKLSVYARGYAPTIFPAQVSSKTKSFELILKKGQTYRGQIVDKDGKPLKETKVRCDEWNVDGDRRHFSVLTKTDSEGMFSVSDVPDIGTLKFGFGKSRTPLQGFSKAMPEDLSKIDKMVMYPVPVFKAKIIDAKTEEPITKFTITQGSNWESTDKASMWSRHYKEEIKSKDGSFERKWKGFGITYPFEGAAFLKIEAEGYYPKSTPPVELGKEYDTFVIKLTKAEQVTGTIVNASGEPAAGAEIGWVGHGKKAFIKDGKFDHRGFSDQTDIIVVSDEKGRFSLNPEKGNALIVVMHKDGYVQIASDAYQNNSEIKLTPWARIEGTVDLGSEGTSDISMTTLDKSSNTDPIPRISWMFYGFSLSGNSFVVEHVPAEPVQIAKNLRFEQHNAKLLEPEPGKTYKVHLGDKGSTVTGKIALVDSSQNYADPRQTHVAVFRVDPESKLPNSIKNLQRKSFNWYYKDQASIYSASKTYQNRFMPNIDEEGNFTFDNIPEGEYELVINLHDPLGENVSCGRGVLRAASVIPFAVKKKSVNLKDIKLEPLAYPDAGQKAPLFTAKTFDGKDIALKDYRGKVVLLEFWATWCGPCIQQMPKIKRLHDAFKDNDDFVLLGMNLDWDVEKAKKFIARKDLNWLQLSLGDMGESEIVSKYGIGGIPTAIVIDRKGNIIAKGIHPEQLEAAIDKILSQNSTAKGRN